MPVHTPKPESLLDPSVLARIGRLDLVARAVVDGFLGGLHRSPTFGSTTDFAEHRNYIPGDDPRRVDWRLWARTDRLHVKEYEADTNTAVSVLMDVSASMGFAGPGRVSKLDYARFLRRRSCGSPASSATASASAPSTRASASSSPRPASTSRSHCTRWSARGRGAPASSPRRSAPSPSSSGGAGSWS
jgi:hypothetical protein